MTTPYALTERDALEALLPRRGPCGLDRPGEPCRIGLHHVRRRKTGPSWGWVAVATCLTHGLSFTIYPPGHVPYGRVPFVDLAPDGTEKRSTREPETIFAAAAEAAAGKRWPADTATAPGGVRSTQRRRVTRAAGILGLVGDEPGHALAAGVAHVPGGLLAEAVRRLAGGCDLTRMGQEVTRVLRDLAGRSGRALMDRLAVLGHLAGLWGRPFRWALRAGRLLALGRPFWDARRARPKARDPSYEFGPRARR